MIETIIWFIVALGILVFVHELGHFLVAKKAGIRVERFSLGFPPKMVGVRVGETEYCLSWIPFGGYVKVAGMADVGSETTKGEPWEFPSKPIWVRMAVIAAGPFMNFLFAFVALIALFLAYGIDTVDSTVVVPRAGSPSAAAGIREGDRVLRVGDRMVRNEYELLKALESASSGEVFVDVERSDKVLSFQLPAAEPEAYGFEVVPPSVVGRVIADMPAADIGLQEGDRITMVAGRPLHSWSQMSTEIRLHPEEEIELVWERGGRMMRARVTPAARVDGGETIGQIGIGVPAARASIGTGEALVMGARSTYDFSWLILGFLAELFQGERSPDELAGPLRIAQLAGQTAARGLEHFISFLAILSVNLAVVNLLPIPVLDGGHLLFLSLEAVMRRPLSLRQREIVQQVGLVMLLFIMVLVTFNDLNQMVFHHITGLFK